MSLDKYNYTDIHAHLSHENIFTWVNFEQAISIGLQFSASTSSERLISSHTSI